MRAAVERAKTIKIVEENSFEESGDNRNKVRTEFRRKSSFKTNSNVWNKFIGWTRGEKGIEKRKRQRERSEGKD